MTGTPSLDGGATLITAFLSLADISRITVKLPLGYRLQSTGAIGESVGFATATTSAGSVRGRLLRSDPGTWQRNTCVPGAHDQVWLITFGDQLAEQAVYVDVEADGLIEWTICPRGVTTLEFANKVTSSPHVAGEYVWHALFESRQDSVEGQAIVKLPWHLELSARQARGFVTLGSTVSAFRDRIAGVRVALLRARRKDMRGGELVAMGRTSETGQVTIHLKQRGVAYYVAQARFDTFDPSTPCVFTPTTTAHCTSAAIGVPYALQSAVTRIRASMQRR